MQEGQVPTSAQQGVVSVQSSGQELFSLTDLLDQYWHVSQCWANHAMAVRDGMSVEVAINTLSRVRDQALLHKGGQRLSRMAATLLKDIVENNADDPEVEADED